jgi:hypothetical protein
MQKRITFVGLDAHKEWIKVAPLLPGEGKAIEWQVANEKACWPSSNTSSAYAGSSSASSN